MAVVCPNCNKSNPDIATYCYFDGMLLKGGATGVAAGQLATPFVFTSGRSCKTFDELVQGCQEEWPAARQLLQDGTFENFFKSIGRMDLVKACQEASQQQDLDIGLSQLLGALPASAAVRGPKLDVNPRRLQLGRVMAGETRKIPIKILNTGQGILHGSLNITEGNEWLKTGGGNGQVSVKTQREQQVVLTVDTRGLSAGEPYAGKLRIVTNGGAEEIPVRIDVGAHPFPKQPFAGAKSPREMAVKMKNNPKAAAALLESGELPKWFAANGWTYPISGTPAKGVAGVQQFFEAMGLAKAPVVKLSHSQVQLLCKVPERPRFRVFIGTPSKKYVYAAVRSDAPWLNILTPSVSGPQKAPVDFEIDSRALPRGKRAETIVEFLANGNQKLKLKIQVEIHRPADSPLFRIVQPVVVMALALFVGRLLLSPVVDFIARPTAVSAAATQSVSVKEEFKKVVDAVADDSPARSTTGWLRLSWLQVLLGSKVTFPEDFFGPPHQGRIINEANFRDYFVKSFTLNVIAFTWWIGPVLGAWLLYRRSGFGDAIWGLLSGAALGIIASATLANLILLGDLVPGFIWGIAFGYESATLLHLLIWVALAVISWTLIGAAFGVALVFLGPIGRIVMSPVQEAFAAVFRLCGLRSLANMFAAS